MYLRYVPRVHEVAVSKLGGKECQFIIKQSKNIIKVIGEQNFLLKFNLKFFLQNNAKAFYKMPFYYLN